MLAEEVLRGVLDFNKLESKGNLMDVLENIAKRSKTAKLWVDMLIKPVFLIMTFVRAEREADWLLHLQACFPISLQPAMCIIQGMGCATLWQWKPSQTRYYTDS